MQWHPISISGYHIREAGSTAAQELAFTLADGFTYVEWAVERGLDVDDFAPRLSFFFNAHLDFFEEIAKYRAARRIWARELRELRRTQPALLADALSTQTTGRLAHGPAAAGEHRPHGDRGARGRTRRDARPALHELLRRRPWRCRPRTQSGSRFRTQQVIAHETGVVNTIDPLGSSYYLEDLTNRIEAQAYEYFERIGKLGGMDEAIKQNFPQKEIADAAFRYQEEVERGERVIVGVNRYQLDEETPLEILKIDAALERKQIDRVTALKGKAADSAKVKAAACGAEAGRVAGEDVNLMPAIFDAARDYVTMGEMSTPGARWERLARDARVLIRLTQPLSN